MYDLPKTIYEQLSVTRLSSGVVIDKDEIAFCIHYSSQYYLIEAMVNFELFLKEVTMEELGIDHLLIASIAKWLPEIIQHPLGFKYHQLLE